MGFRFWFYSLCNTALRGTLALFCDHRVEGRENVPRSGPLLVVANHQSNMDPPMVAVSLPRNSRFLAKDGLFRLPHAALFLRAYGAHPLKRDQADRRAYQWVLDRLASPDGVVTMFPEGTRSPGKMRRARAGIAGLAIRSGATVLPIGIQGTETYGSYMRVFYPKGKIRVRIGRPFRLVDLPGPASKELLEDITTEIMGRIAELIPEEYHGYYAAPRPGWRHTVEVPDPGETAAAGRPRGRSGPGAERDKTGPAVAGEREA